MIPDCSYSYPAQSGNPLDNPSSAHDCTAALFGARCYLRRGHEEDDTTIRLWQDPNIRLIGHDLRGSGKREQGEE
ncbi:MAG: hypothetical protein DDT20_01700 [Firmicutes bacterium]|nr:hypothetical protein [Bacillota bacterium]